MFLERIGALSGVAFIALFVAGFVLSGDSDSPSPDDPAGAIATYMADNATGQDLSIGLSLTAVACLVVFVSYLRQVLQRAEPSRTFLPAAAWAGGLLYAAMLLGLIAIEVAGGVITNYGDDTEVAKTLYVVEWDFITVFGPPLAVLIGATSAAALLHGGLPRWLGWAGLPLVVGLLSPAMYFGFILTLPWLIALSIALTARTMRPPSSALVSQPA
jgi:hypothetical protein